MSSTLYACVSKSLCAQRASPLQAKWARFCWNHEVERKIVVTQGSGVDLGHDVFSEDLHLILERGCPGRHQMLVDLASAEAPDGLLVCLAAGSYLTSPAVRRSG